MDRVLTDQEIIKPKEHSSWSRLQFKRICSPTLLHLDARVQPLQVLALKMFTLFTLPLNVRAMQESMV
jgi:hypothetical protein